MANVSVYRHILSNHLRPQREGVPGNLTIGMSDADVNAAVERIKREEPAWFATQMQMLPQFGQNAAVTGSGPSAMLSWTPPPKGEDLDAIKFLASVYGVSSLGNMASNWLAGTPAAAVSAGSTATAGNGWFGAGEGWQVAGNPGAGGLGSSGVSVPSTFGGEMTLSEQLAAALEGQGGTNYGFTGDVGAATGAGTGIEVPSWFGEAGGAGLTASQKLSLALSGASGAANYGFGGDPGDPTGTTGVNVPEGFGEDYGKLESLLKAGVPLAQAMKLLGGNGAGGMSPIASLLGLGQGGSDILSLLGRAAPGLLGAVASNQQTDALRDLSREERAAQEARYQDLVAREAQRFQLLKEREDAAIGRQQEAMQFGRAVGQPSRDRYEGSYQPGFTMANDPGFMDALGLSSKATLHGLSVNGNPADSPNAWAQSQQDNFSKFAYPALQNYRQLNAQTGGYTSYGQSGASIPGTGSSLPSSPTAGSGVGTQAGADTAMNAVKSSGNIWNSLGAAAGNVFSPPKSLTDQLMEFRTLSGAY